jgi:hypothetical protein
MAGHCGAEPVHQQVFGACARRAREWRRSAIGRQRRRAGRWGGHQGVLMNEIGTNPEWSYQLHFCESSQPDQIAPAARSAAMRPRCAQFAQDGIGVLAHGGHGVHAVVEACCARRQQRGHRAGGRAHAAPAIRAPAVAGAPTGRPCRSCGVGDLRLRPGAATTCSASACAKALRISAFSASRCSLRRALLSKRGSVGQRRLQQHLVAEHLPLALVLQAQHHRAAIVPAGNGP